MNGSAAPPIVVEYDVPEDDAQWELAEEGVPEPAWHDAVLDLLKAVLRALAARGTVGALVAGNLALRWSRENWKVDVDPDVALYVQPPPDGGDTTSVCTWKPGHAPPRVAVEVVSESTAAKDYVTAPDQYAASGTAELWVFDPKRHGPRLHGGPFVLQVWRREGGVFRRVYRGDGPFQSPELGGWLVVTEGGRWLRLADDAEVTRPWPTATEQAEAELAALRAELERLRRGG